MTIAQDVAEQLVEVRCPAGRVGPDGECHPGRLFMLLRLSGEQPSFVHPDNLIELACAECKKRLRDRGTDVLRVLHRYDLAGRLIETLTEPGPSA